MPSLGLIEIATGRRRPTLFLFLLLAAVVWARPATARAAVAVLDNRSERRVEFRLERADGEVSDLTLAPGEVAKVPVVDSVALRFQADGEEVSERIDPNTLYRFVTKRKKLRLERFSGSNSSRWLRTAGRAGPPKPVSVPVKVLADEEYAESHAEWPARLRERVAAASQPLEECCGVRFEVVAQGTWESEDDETDFRRLEAEFRRRAFADSARLAIGVTGQYRITEEHPLAHPDLRPFASHLLLPEVQKGVTEADQTALLVHQLGHFLAAAHSPDDSSVMRSPLVEGKKEPKRRPASSQFDAVNTLVLNLVADEIRARTIGRLSEIERGTRSRLRAIYGQMAREVRGDRQPGHFVELLREPFRPCARYTGKWTDGTTRKAETVGPWHEAESLPSLSGKPLFSGPHPIRWLADNSLEPADPPDALVEFFGGDRLPGRVVGPAGGEGSIDGWQPRHLVLSPYAQVDLPNARRPHVRVRTEWIRRIVWQSATDRYRPQTLLLRDGRRLDFRAVRLTGSSIRLLREEGVREVALADVAELHFGRIDPWDAYFDQLTELSPGGAARLVVLETADGLRATGSLDRFQATAYGSHDDPANWYHGVQPAWSLDALWLPHRPIRVRCYFAPHEVPLSRIEADEVREQPGLRGGTWQAERNVEGGPLQSDGQAFFWGLGVHGSVEMEFPLPDGAVALHTHLGLDELAGHGGCVEARVFLGSPHGEPLFSSGPIVGSDQVLSTGRLALDGTGGGSPSAQDRLVLEVDALHEGRPAGADPFDVRDAFDWLEPLVDLDPRQVQAEVFRRGPGRIAAWQGWQATSGDAEGARLANYWDRTDSHAPVFRLMAAADAVPLQLSRTIDVRPDRYRLLLAVSRPSDRPGSKIEVEIDGKPITEFDVPTRHGRELPDPLAVSLSDYEGREIRIDLIQRGEGEGALVEWRAIAFADAVDS